MGLLMQIQKNGNYIETKSKGGKKDNEFRLLKF